MKFEAGCFLNACVAGDIDSKHYRPNLSAVYYDKAKHRLCACNGVVLATIPVTDDQHDVAGFVSVETMKEAAKVGVLLLDEVNENLANGTSRKRLMFSAPFPEIDKVIPSYKCGDKGTVTLGFDAEYLVNVVKAIGARVRDGEEKGRRVVWLTIPTPKNATENLEPIRVEGGDVGSVAVMMPFRKEG